MKGNYTKNRKSYQDYMQFLLTGLENIWSWKILRVLLVLEYVNLHRISHNVIKSQLLSKR